MERRKFYTVVCIATFTVLAISNFCFAKYSGGDGTSTNPYQIANPNDLLLLAADTNDYNDCFVLVNDINLAGYTFDKAVIAPNIGSIPVFIGVSFTGVFDGNGHKITHLAINGGSNSYLGFFGMIGSRGSVKHLGIENFTVGGASGVGGLAGVNSGNINNCYSTGEVSGISSVGCLVGYNTGSISNCYSTGEVSGGSSSSSVGGLVGLNYGSISKCYSTGAVSGTSSVGGLVGYKSSGTVTACFWDTDTSGQTISAGGTGMTTVQMQTVATFTSAGWTFLSNSNGLGNWLMPESGYPKLACEVYTPVSVPDIKGLTAADANMTLAAAGLVQGESYYVYDLSVAAGTVSGTAPISGTIVYSGFTKVHLLLAKDFRYAGGTGVQEDPYQISNYGNMQDLIGTPSDWNKYFILTADIDMKWKAFTTAVIAPDTNSSVGGFQGTVFTGTFDGNGHKIFRFTVNGGSQNYLGLFGQIGNGGSVKNLGIEDFTVSGYSYVGGLAGYNSNGGISNCYSIGVVSGYQYVGGLVGYNSIGNINNCYANGNVKGSSNSYWVGGLVGKNNGSISKCYSTGGVSGFWQVGGLVGQNNGSISNCYATGTVIGSSGSYAIAGLVGQSESITANAISKCYSTGAVSAGSDSTWLGGLIGVNSNLNVDTVTACFWDVNSSGQTTSYGGTGMTTTQMKTLSTFTSAGWDFLGIWGIDEGYTYPFLKIGSNAGTPENPYLIATKADLLMMAADTSYYGKCFIVTADIDMAGQVFTTAIIAPNTNLSSSFTGTAFTGTFDGNGHKITHFTINGGGNYFLGLFGQIGSGGSVKNLGVEDCTVSGYQYVSGLAGINYGSISNCYSTGSVNGSSSGSRYVGGLVGCNYGSISNCYSTGSVNGGSSGSRYVGGLVGGNISGASITTCYATGAVSGSSGSYYVGGLVGYNISGASITTCYATGAVSGSSGSYYVGGLVGYNISGASITTCYATGAVSGSQVVGGLVGSNNNGASITTCYATGAVSGSQVVGGLVGSNNSGSISNCYSTGAVTGGDESRYLGGLVGGNGGSISNCYSTGAVSGAGYVGGLVGGNTGSISNCYSTGVVSGYFEVGGLVGYSYEGSISNSFWDMDTSGQTISAGGTGLSTLQMKQQSSFVGWDFSYMDGDEAIWFMAFDGYPILPWQISDADIYTDGKNNLKDWTVFARYWMREDCRMYNDFCEFADMDFDGDVDIDDLAEFMGYWLEEGIY